MKNRFKEKEKRSINPIRNASITVTNIEIIILKRDINGIFLNREYDTYL